MMERIMSLLRSSPRKWFTDLADYVKHETVPSYQRDYTSYDYVVMLRDNPNLDGENARIQRRYGDYLQIETNPQFKNKYVAEPVAYPKHKPELRHQVFFGVEEYVPLTYIEDRVKFEYIAKRIIKRYLTTSGRWVTTPSQTAIQRFSSVEEAKETIKKLEKENKTREEFLSQPPKIIGGI